MNLHRGIKAGLLVAIVAFYLYSNWMQHQIGVYWEIDGVFHSFDWMLLICLTAWCATFLIATFELRDLPLIALLLLAITFYCISAVIRPSNGAIALLSGATLGQSAKFLLQSEKQKIENEGTKPKVKSQRSETRGFLVCLVGLLAISSWWHVDPSENPYHGPRWMGLWNNPNIYGMLMGAGLVLAVGLLAARGVANRRSPIANREEEWSGEDGKSDADILRRNLGLARLLQLSLVVAMFMMGVGLVMSYSRGAWLGTALGLQYLAKRHGKFSWRWVLAGILVAAAVTIGFWHRTMDDAPWYIMRLDLSRPSAQHRVAAWHGALQMMWDHPFGVGWDNAAIVYGKNYLPPKNGIAAITTNDYLMLGTQLGWPALICFVAYVGLCLKAERVTLCAPRLGSCQDSAREVWRPAILLGLFPPRRPGTFRQESTSPLTRRLSLATLDTFATPRQYEGALIQAASRSAALSMLVAFWFNSGLFDLATASIFWILLELGKIETKAKR